MTAPTALTARPAAHITEVLSSRVLGDLWAASEIAGTERIAEGVVVHPAHGSAHGTWPLPCVGEPADDASKDGERLQPTWFPPTVVWAADECSTVGNTETRSDGMAEVTLSHDARYRLEAHYISHVLGLPATAAEDVPTGRLVTVTAPPPLTGVSTLVTALGGLENAMRRWGHIGVVHASAVLLPVMAHLNLVRRDSDRLLTPGGHVWAFGSGYDSLDTDTLIGTGPTTIHLTEVTPVVETDTRQNRIYALREYIAAVTHTDHAIRVVAA